MINIIAFIVLMSALIIIHEFGHLIAAKMFGVYVQEFSIGMGNKLFSFKGKETEYAFRMLPLGGFVAMAGDADNALETSVEVEVPTERTLNGIAPIKRMIIMSAGILMNFLLAFVIISLILLNTGTYGVSSKPVISEVMTGSAGEESGLLPGDNIVEGWFSNGQRVKPKNYADLNVFLSQYESGVIYLTVDRNNEKLDFAINPRFNAEENRYMIGISFESYDYKEVNITNCGYYALDYMGEMLRIMITTIMDLFRGYGLNNLSGPVGIYNATSEAVSGGAVVYFNLMAVLSMNLAIMNALPLPVLDGGRVFMLLFEVITGKQISEKVMNFIMAVSVGLLILLMLFSTYQDILRIFI